MLLRLLVFALLLTTGFPPSLRAQTVPPTRYRVDQFTSDQGLPGHQIYDIEQTADGYLWVATNAGLARFDGHQFAVFNADNTPLPTNQAFTDLYLGAGDTLFMIAMDAHVLHYADGDFTDHTTKIQLADLAQDRTGRLWGIGGTPGNDLLYEKDGHFEPFAKAISSWIDPRLFVDAAGDIWLFLLKDKVPETAGNPSGPASWYCFASPDVQVILARLEGDHLMPKGPTLYPYIITSPSRREVLFSRVNGEMIEFLNAQEEVRGRYGLPVEACPMLIDHEGYIWARGKASLDIYAPGERVPASSLDLPFKPEEITQWFEDRAHNVWIGTFNRGLFRIRKNPFQVYARPQGIEKANVTTMVQGKDGSILVRAIARDAQYGRDVYRIEGQHAIRMIDDVMGIYEDPQGRLLYFKQAKERRTHQLFLLKEGQTRFLGETTGASLNQQIYPDPQEAGVFWTHSYDAVYRLTDPMGPAPTLTKILEGLTDVRQLFKDRTGVLWVGTSDGLYRLEGQQSTRFTTDDGLPENRVRAIHQDPDGILWFGTYGGGLVRFKNERFQTVNETQGLAENIVSTILEDDHGYFWMSGNHGVHRAYRPELNALLDGQRDHVTGVLYGRDAGLLNPEASGLPGLKADDGRLWFPTFEGAAVVDPTAAVAMDQAPPLVHVQEVLIDNEPVGQRAVVQLRADQRRFEIAYVGINLRNPEAVRYRYKLDGFDRDWIEAGTARRATYTNVSPGTYTFRVQARNFAGIWSEQDGMLRLSVAPFFYETAWFYGLCVLVVLALAFGGYRVRLRQLIVRELALNRLVRERTQALTQEKETVAAQAEELRSLDEAKSRFFANISHEFRTPLTLILGPLEDLKENLYGVLSGSSLRQINTALRNGRRLSRLVNQLLDVSRLESGKITLQAQERDMTSFVARAVQAFVPMAEYKHITFRFEGPGHPVPVYFDPGQFEKVLANLLGNAFKFTPEHGTIVVTLVTEETGNGPGAMVLTVRDNGPGIAPEHLPHLFERFYQVDASSTRRQAGTGIGLALVQNLVALHRGTVEVESHVGLGTVFTVRLPLGQAHLNAEEIVPPDVNEGGHDVDVVPEADPPVNPADEIQVTPSASTDAGTPVAATTVLVVDDNPDVRAYVRRHLARRYRVIEAPDGRQALERARKDLPDLVVSDVMMPEMDGFGLCRAMKRDPELDFIPVILLTAKASSRSKIEGLEEGADDYLTKPFNVRELEVRVENLIATRQRLKARYTNASTGSIRLHGSPTPASMPDEKAAFVERVRTEIEARLSEDDFGVDALAAAVGLGRTTLYSRLNEAFSQTPMDLIWMMRLERAAALLCHGQGTVSEVAYGVGFKSVAHFCHRFREQFGLTPAAYAAQHDADA